MQSVNKDIGASVAWGVSKAKWETRWKTGTRAATKKRARKRKTSRPRSGADGGGAATSSNGRAMFAAQETAFMH